MARKVFFSFDYERDIWRANVVRNTGLVEGFSTAGFDDVILWRETRKKKGDAEVKKLIDTALVGTEVTVVLIGADTATQEIVEYEIEQSIARRNGLLGICISGIEDQRGNIDVQGPAPSRLTRAGASCYPWNREKFADWVDEAYHIQAFFGSGWAAL